MPKVRRQAYTRAIPADAVPVTIRRKGKPDSPGVRFTADSQPVTAPLTRDGKRCRVESPVWYGEYKDALGVRRRVPLGTNKAAAEMQLADITRRVEQEKAGVRDAYSDHRTAPLSGLLDEFGRFQAGKGATDKQVKQVRRRCELTFEGSRAVLLHQLDGSAAEAWLADQQRTRTRFGPSTRNGYTKALKAFGRWLTVSRKAAENPFRHLTAVNAKLDVRKERRALAADESVRLLTATRAGKKKLHLSGPDREMLYLVASFTGLRASELASLHPASFALDASPPTLTVEAAFSKHRREDVAPLHPDLVARLRPWLAARPSDLPLWPGRWALDNAGCDLIKYDLAAARRQWLAEARGPAERAGREATDFLCYTAHDGTTADFHALRHTFITNVVAAGVNPKDAQTLARHSTITLTMDRYAHVGLRDQAAAVGRLTLPPDPASDPQAVPLPATGTDGRRSDNGLLPYPILTPTGDGGRGKLSVIGGTDDPTVPAAGGRNCLEERALEGERGQAREYTRQDLNLKPSAPEADARAKKL